MLKSVRQFLTEVRGELNKVKFPNRADTVKLTSTVLAISFVLGVYIGSIDYLLTKLIEKFLG